jgi:hypothetical protein
MSGIRSLYRGSAQRGPATAASAPIRVDDTSGQIKLNGAGSGSTETTVADSANSKAAFSTGTVTPFATDTYLVGSACALPTGGPIAGATYQLVFDMTKTAAGTATPILVIRIGTAGTVADAAILTFTFAAGTAAVDNGLITVYAHFRTIGSGTTAVLVGLAEINHALAATGLTATGASGWAGIGVVSSGFDSTVAGSIIGASFNGGASFAGTCTLVDASLRSF